jgi:hypothetical protein
VTEVIQAKDINPRLERINWLLAMNPADTRVPEKQNQDKLARFRRSLKAARDLQNTKLVMRVKGKEVRL